MTITVQHWSNQENKIPQDLKIKFWVKRREDSAFWAKSWVKVPIIDIFSSTRASWCHPLVLWESKGNPWFRLPNIHIQIPEGALTVQNKLIPTPETQESSNTASLSGKQSYKNPQKRGDSGSRKIIHVDAYVWGKHQRCCRWHPQ